MILSIFIASIYLFFDISCKIRLPRYEGRRKGSRFDLYEIYLNISAAEIQRQRQRQWQQQFDNIDNNSDFGNNINFGNSSDFDNNNKSNDNKNDDCNNSDNT